VQHAKLVSISQSGRPDPQLQDWNEGKGIDPLDWAGCTGNLQLAIAYSVLFWPKFMVFENYVFRPGVSEESIRS
jgi:hypothetical protein